MWRHGTWKGSLQTKTSYILAPWQGCFQSSRVNACSCSQTSICVLAHNPIFICSESFFWMDILCKKFHFWFHMHGLRRIPDQIAMICRLQMTYLWLDSFINLHPHPFFHMPEVSLAFHLGTRNQDPPAPPPKQVPIKRPPVKRPPVKPPHKASWCVRLVFHVCFFFIYLKSHRQYFSCLISHAWSFSFETWNKVASKEPSSLSSETSSFVHWLTRLVYCLLCSYLVFHLTCNMGEGSSCSGAGFIFLRPCTKVCVWTH